jgi:hypothetical protein
MVEEKGSFCGPASNRHMAYNALAKSIIFENIRSLPLRNATRRNLLFFQAAAMFFYRYHTTLHRFS